MICLANALDKNESRAIVLVSCRVSDWRAVQDRTTFEEVLGKPAEVESTTSPSPSGFDDESLYAALFADNQEANKSTDEQKKAIAQDYKPHIVALESRSSIRS